MNVEELLKTNGSEKPLDVIVADGGLCSIFRTFGCIGDGLASGEFEGTDESGGKTYNDFFEYSWGQYIARAAGCRVHNFSRGGMTAKEFTESFGDKKGCWNSENACQAYIIALGVNDIYNLKMETGSVADIDLSNYQNNRETFAGYYGKIVQRIKSIAPDAKLFFMTMPRESFEQEKLAAGDSHAELLREMAKLFSNSYVIDLRKYAPVYDEEFKRNYYLGGHMQPCGYVVTAYMVMSYIDWIIRHNIGDFKQVGFIGTPHKNTVAQ